MALNSRMHPRNIYRKPPDFKELAIKYPEFRKYVKQELSGRVSLDYNDRNAVMELTRILLLKDFDLRVKINEARLIPRVPLCLNYILWIEDLLSNLNKGEEIRGVDIGTGSVCIYSLLGCTKGWNMLATEIDRASFENAVENVHRNNLNAKITVKLVEDANKLLLGVIDENLYYDFCMCNPPFFDTNEKPLNRTRKRKIIDTVASYVNTDTTTRGGEFEFVKKLINESQNLGSKVKIYTTLIGKKADFIRLKKELLKVNPTAVTGTEFCQGNTTRWALAWSFSNIKLREEKVKLKKSEPKSLQFFVSGEKCNFKVAVKEVEKILRDLKVTYTMEYLYERYVYTLKAYENTWCHQRRKNRLKQRQQMKSSSDAQKAGEEINVDKCYNSPDAENFPEKKMKVDFDLTKDKESFISPKEPIIECLLVLTYENDNIEFKFTWLSGNKEYVHQIYQFLKNYWTKVEENDVCEGDT